jgi:WD40 repeat protein
MVVEDATPMDSFRRVVAALTQAPAARKAALADIVASMPPDTQLKRLVEQQRPRLEVQGLPALLFAATARPVNDELRQVAERWLEESNPVSMAPWIRYVEGDALSPRSEPRSSTVANKTQTLGMLRSKDGSFWTWGGKSGRELRRLSAVDGAELATARANFDLGEGDVGDNGWIALGCPHDESVVSVWDCAGKRMHRFDSGRNFSWPRWLPNAPTPTLLVADGSLACLDLGQKKLRERWRYEHADKNALRPIEHLAVSSNGSGIFVLEIDWDGVGAARCLVLSPEDGTVMRSVPLELRFGNDDSGTMSLSPDGRLLAFASDLKPSPCGLGVFTLDLETGALKHHFAPNLSISTLCFESRTELWCGTGDGIVIRCDLDRGTFQALRTGSSAVVAISPVGDDLFVALLNGNLLRFSRRDCAFNLEDLPLLEPGRRICAVPSESRALIFTDEGVRQVREGDSTTSVLASIAGLSRTIMAIDAHADWAASVEQLLNRTPLESILTVRSLHASQRAAPHTTQVRGNIRHVLLSPAAAWFECDAGKERLISVRHDTGEWVVHTAWGSHDLNAFCWCAATNELACAVRHVGLVLLNENGKQVHELHASRDIEPTAVFGLGPRLLAMFEDGTLRIFTLADRKPCSELTFISGRPEWNKRRSLCGSEDTDRAVAASSYGPALLFAPSKGETIASLSQGKPVVFAEMSRDGRLVLTVDEGALLSVWNASDGKLVVCLAFDALPWGVVWVGSREILVREYKNKIVRLRLEGGLN